MTGLPTEKRWMLSRVTKMESGEDHIDGVAIRVCMRLRFLS